MMTGIIKTTLKLLFRNIIFWVFLIAMPVLSTLMLRLHAENSDHAMRPNAEK